MKTIRVPASLTFLDRVMEEADEYLAGIGCSKRFRLETQLILEELFTNISYYSYPEEKEDNYCQIEFEPNGNELLIRLIDEGIPFDPTAAETPETHIPYQERKSGGLGIFLVRSYTTDMDYRHDGKRNILTLHRNLQETPGES